MTLTCKRCNNADGAHLDAHFVMIEAQIGGDGDGLSLGRQNTSRERLSTDDFPGTRHSPRIITIRAEKPDVLKKFDTSMRSSAEGHE